MRWTNKYNLDEIIAGVIMRRESRIGDLGDFTVTTLCQPPQAAALSYLHYREIERDVSGGLWMLLGKAIHSVLEMAEMDNTLQEERLYTDVDGVKISGQPDLWRPPSELIDFKVTSVWAFLLRPRPEWAEQINYYAVLYRRHGFDVESAKVLAILRDWSQPRCRRCKQPMAYEGERWACGRCVDQIDDRYPPAPFRDWPVPLWRPEETEARLAARVREHVEARKGTWRPCTDEERWAEPDVWAVRKKGGDRALPGGARFADERSARNWAAEKAFETEVDFRPGGSRRCAQYCDAAPWCLQAQELGVVREAAEDGMI